MGKSPSEHFAVTPLGRAASPLERGRGLLGSPQPGDGEGLVLERARQVHTFGMRYSIDVLFCDAEWRVLHVVRDLRPFRVTRWVRGARYAIEMRAGAVSEDVDRGTVVVLKDP